VDLESVGRETLRQGGGNMARVGFENWHVRSSRHFFFFHLTTENLRDWGNDGIVLLMLVILRESPYGFLCFEHVPNSTCGMDRTR
jgi:hypothetical protein